MELFTTLEIESTASEDEYPWTKDTFMDKMKEIWKTMTNNEKATVLKLFKNKKVVI